MRNIGNQLRFKMLAFHPLIDCAVDAVSDIV